MPKRQRGTAAATEKPGAPPLALSPPRIVGGHLRGRKLLYHGDERTRPMKDRVREALFNLLGPQVKDKQAIDLFAGTGALGFEALSRGAARAIFIEQHFPTAELIRRTAAELGVAEQCRVTAGNAFIWAKRDLPPDGPPWVVFVSPPWALFGERASEMVELVGIFVRQSPPESVVVVEADAQFDFSSLPEPDAWNVRAYPPAVVGILRK